MPDSKSNLASSHGDVINVTSDLSEIKISDEKGSVAKRTRTLIEKNDYPDAVYMNAAKIFQGIRTEKSKDSKLVHYGNNLESPMLAFKDEHCRRVSYELAFSALKYQSLLEEILLDSGAYPCYSIPDELTSLLVVMLYDLQGRKFAARKIFDEEETVAEVQEVGHYLYSCRIKLAAALARCRIKHDALSIDYFVPETIWKQEQRVSALPFCVWINTYKISLQDVIRDLEMKGLTKVESVSDFEHYTYAMDQHCHDVLVFPSSLKEELLDLDLFADCKLLLQDKSRSLAVHSAQALLNAGDDIIVAHIGSHLTIAHMSVLTNHSMPTIFVCGVKSSAKEEQLRNIFSHMGCENIQLLHEDFTELEPTDSRLQKARVILLLPQCSGLGVGNPMEFILSEHRDAGLLRDVFQGFVSEDKLSILAERQLKELIHALKFKKVQAIVYCTCSVYPQENELVVKKALEYGVEGDKPYRIIPPIFDTCSNSEASTEIFFKMEPSEISSGCFVAVLEREKDSSQKMPAKDILAYAAEEGLLDSPFEEQPKEEKKKQKVKRRRRNVSGTDSKPKAAEPLHGQTGANVKAEVPVSKAVSNKNQKNVHRTKAVSDTQQKHMCKTKAVSNTQQKHVHQTESVSNTQQKHVHRTKAASNTQQKHVFKTKAASNTQEKHAHRTKAASNTQQKHVCKTKAVSNTQQKHVCKTKAASNTQQKHVCKTKAVSNTKKKHVCKTKAVSNTKKKHVCKTKAASNTQQKHVRRTKAASNTQQKHVHQTKAASNTQKKHVCKTKAISNTQQKHVCKTKAASNTQQKHVCKTKAVSNTQQKHVRRTKAASNTQKKHVCKTKAASNTQQKHVHQTKAATQKHVHRTKAASNISVSKAGCSTQQNNVHRANSHVQVQESTTSDSHQALPEVPKCTSHLSPLGKVPERQTPAQRASTGHNRIVLEPTKIILPPE